MIFFCYPTHPFFGAIAQLGERLLCTQEVGSSILPGSTIINFIAFKPAVYVGLKNIKKQEMRYTETP